MLRRWRASSYLTRYSAAFRGDGRGTVEITISVVANQRVSELGASYILLEVDIGGTWSTAKEYEGESWMTAEPLQLQQDPFVSGTIGHQYRVTADVFRTPTASTAVPSHLLRGYGKR